MVVHTKLIKYRTETEVTMVPREWKNKYEMKKIVPEVWDHAIHLKIPTSEVSTNQFNQVLPQFLKT